MAAIPTIQKRFNSHSTILKTLWFRAMGNYPITGAGTGPFSVNEDISEIPEQVQLMMPREGIDMEKVSKKR
ncbi:MAG: hypothetical protein R2940_00935 [Syntrophotaleaceae bacterium]